MTYLLLIALVPVLDWATYAAFGPEAIRRRARRRAAELDALYSRYAR